MSRSRLPTYLGVAAAGGVGYYLYKSGGNPKVAGQQAKRMLTLPKLTDDVSKALPGSPERPKIATEVGSKIDNAAYETEKNFNSAKNNVEAYARDRKNEIMHGIDKADQKIEEKAAKAKGWFSSGK
ncbi:hypothetical protein jhhlp_006144 [Lomentospora prolificans]|uniref:Uncharacterized protein n=1 Tax=Lomentospora prolificans TaxID=41688 RepID=A0A2N3N526_9PEZI|nr:hypothetical protein jhhlp_006144 [Lomentospora prolificans]